MNSKYLLSTVIILIILESVLYFVQPYLGVVFPSVVYIVAAVMAALAFVFGTWISKAINERPALYVNRFMIALLVKMMGFLIFVGVSFYVELDNVLYVALSLLVVYMIFTVHMIIFLKNAEKRNRISQGV